MSLRGLFEVINEHPTYHRLLEGLRRNLRPKAARKREGVERVSAPDGAKPYLLAALWEHLGAPMLVVVPRPEDARHLHEQIISYAGDDAPAYLLPEPEMLPFERLVADAATNNHRMLALASFLPPHTPSNQWGPEGDRSHSSNKASKKASDKTPKKASNKAPVGGDADESGRSGGEGGYHPPMLIASTSAALRKTLPPDTLRAAWHTLETGGRVSLAELFSRWVSLGYQREEAVEVPGTFSHRGGIVDIYPPSSSLPARIELWGDEIDSIRLFDPGTQRSVRRVESVSILPAHEILPSLAKDSRVSGLIGRMDFSNCTTAVRERFEEEIAALFSGHVVEELPLYNGLLNHGCLVDHLPEGGLLVLDREGEIESESQELAGRAEMLRSAREGRGELPSNFPAPQLSWGEFRQAMENRPRLLVSRWAGAPSLGDAEDGGDMDFQAAPAYYGRLGDGFASDVREMLVEGRRVVMVSRHARRLSEVLAEGGVGSAVISSLSDSPPMGSLSLLAGSLREGWILPSPPAVPTPEGTKGSLTNKVSDGQGVGREGSITLLTDSEIFGVAKERRARLKTPVRRETFISELVPGGHVVHVDHGVARFAGSIQMESEGEQKEYLVLEYAEGDKLYVPTEHLDRISPYMAPHDQTPPVTRLGTAEWGRMKERVKSSTREMAQELLDLYASRHAAEGHQFSPDSPWQQELEDSFPYEETPDQARTIQETKEDMEQTRPMDRLVCGDVGYGKTEIALRAAFKTVNDGMQVGILVPTTVLAQQHYATFSERLSPFPIRVDVLSRFRTRKEQKGIVEAISSGEVDIVIGTHRLLQKDVRFKNLGLVVVDEEQRFGVSHKERLKRMRREVDILTLSATPIPRTLHMGLSGIRDMSTMETPPEERLPVKTYVSEYSDDVIKEAVLREIERGGQVFFLHNRVRTIQRAAENLQKLVPQARIAIGHGQMNEDELEDVMVAFSQGDVDVLMCTTIIESGLDIPNANTLIIDRADRFGLSQLYQLRGRVGRGRHRAYTYLLIPRGRRITEAAGKRLKAILEAAELGAGFRIAMRDLEIRGAGNILGAEQSGNIHAVGFELYTQMLNEAVSELKAVQGDAKSAPGEDQAKSPARVSLSLSAHIPESYISHLPTRLAVYQRLTRVRQRPEVEGIREELQDRFGPLPSVVDNLLYLVYLKLLAGEAGIEAVAQSGSNVTLSLQEAVGGAKLPLEKALGPLARVGNQQVHVSVRGPGDRWKESLLRIIHRLMAFKEEMESVVVPT